MEEAVRPDKSLPQLIFVIQPDEEHLGVRPQRRNDRCLIGPQDSPYRRAGDPIIRCGPEARYIGHDPERRAVFGQLRGIDFCPLMSARPLSAPLESFPRPRMEESIKKVMVLCNAAALVNLVSFAARAG